MKKKIEVNLPDSSLSLEDSETSLTFEELRIEPAIIKAISELGFKTPTPIQQETMPVLFDSKNDLIGLAQTGTGKTAAYGIPLIQQADSSSPQTKALILSPTRELCVQIANDLLTFCRYKKGIRVVPVYGGSSMETQFKELERGAQIITATPGRMLDMINRGKADVSAIETLVLDEADEMLNMGFKEELDAILENTPAEKRTLLFSATMSRDVESIALKYMSDPIEITIGRKNEGAENVSHLYYLVHARDRYLAIKRIIDYNPDIYSIIFCRTRAETRDIANLLMKDGYNADALHGDLSQAQRDTVMKKFRMRHLQILVATDVAARGLDVEGLTHIINFSLPDDDEQYTHRSGRTGRAGKSGVSIAIINLREKYKIRNIEKRIGKRFKRAEVPTGRKICEKQLFHLVDQIEKVDLYNEEIESFLPTIYKKLEYLERDELIKRFISREFNYFLEYYKNTEDINVDEKKSTRREPAFDQMCRFFINLGRKDSLTPPLLIGLINDISRSFSINIGKIDIMHSFSFFEAGEQWKEEILTALNKRKFKGRKLVVGEADQNAGGPRKFKDKNNKKPKRKEFEKKRQKRHKKHRKG